MPELRLTKRAIELLPFPSVGQVLYRDCTLPGFGVRVGARSKVYFVEARVDRQNIRTTLGRADLMAPELARKKAMQVLGEMAAGKNPNRGKAPEKRLTVARAFARFLEAKPNLAPSSVSGYSRTFDLYLKSWRKYELSKLTRDMILQRHRQISSAHGKTTANNVMRHLRSVYNFAAGALADLPPNPVTVLTQTRTWHREQRRRGVVPHTALPAWWRAVLSEGDDARDVLLTALFTGMRRSEIIGLKWEHLDLAGKTLLVPRTKNGDPLQLPLAPFLVDLFKARRERAGRSEYVFPSTGKTGHLVETKTFVERVRTASGVTFTMHDLRRTFISIAESLDIPAYALKRLLNHRADTDVTGGYIVIGVERLRLPVERIAARILELADERQKTTRG